MTMILENDAEPRSWARAIWRGARRACPACGLGRVFASFMKVSPRCGSCGEELHHHRADDAPPYFTIFLVGHIVIPSVLIVEKLWRPALSTHFIVWTFVTLALTFLLMPSVKGAIVGLQWALRMHGFDLASRHEGE